MLPAAWRAIITKQVIDKQTKQVSVGKQRNMLWLMNTDWNVIHLTAEFKCYW